MMAADVSMEIKSEANSGLITRDFLGGCFGIESKELDLDLHVPNGWEKRLDLKSGKVYIQKSHQSNPSSEHRNSPNQTLTNLHKSNTISQQSLSSPNNLINTTLGLLGPPPSLDLKLVPNTPHTSYTSVCTLDKVKSALDRAERASPTSSSSSSSSKKRWSMIPSKSPPLEEEPTSQSEGLLVAGACPVCLLYVLISKSDPKCPKCSSSVELPVMCKKPRIDLNMSI